VEEYYFRGYLLPRLSRFGSLAPVINVALFSLYHFFTPWQAYAHPGGDAHGLGGDAQTQFVHRHRRPFGIEYHQPAAGLAENNGPVA
jgi:hypothetical protein